MIQILTRALLAGFLMMGAAKAEDAADPTKWPGLLEQAKGQTVYWHAWGGEPRINDYIASAGREIETRSGVELVPVQVNDTGSVVSQFLAEKTAGTLDGGSVDLIWINGENLAAVKR